MTAVLVVLCALVVVVRWRLSHRRRRRAEYLAALAARQPLTEWSARYSPAERMGRMRRMTLRRRRKWGF